MVLDEKAAKPHFSSGKHVFDMTRCQVEEQLAEQFQPEIRQKQIIILKAEFNNKKFKINKIYIQSIIFSRFIVLLCNFIIEYVLEHLVRYQALQKIFLKLKQCTVLNLKIKIGVLFWLKKICMSLTEIETF
ncbi:Hypothetical_protein [Hexamita inflata]|uniref:Hypothetical_protein n=1 Tax=Hexamita inflata TaxID=28002 RepID=A0AA86NGP1_9EUKA|nr:Hypothetical protein HINF_LOCUS6351 [Hexamita inflata]